MTKQTANLKKPSRKTRRWLWIVPVVIVVCGIIIILGLYSGWFSNPLEETPTPSPVQAGSKLEDKISEPRKAPVAVRKKIEQEKKKNPSSAVKQRKEELGLKKSLAVVVKHDVSIRGGKEKEKNPSSAVKKRKEELELKKSVTVVVKHDESIRGGKEKEKDLNRAVKKRKEELGLKKSVDVVVKPGESIRIGKEEIPLNIILAEIEKQRKEKPLSPKTFLRQLKIPEEDIKTGETSSAMLNRQKPAGKTLSASPADDRIRGKKNQTEAGQAQPTKKPGTVAMAEKPEKTVPAKKSLLRRIIDRILGRSAKKTPSETKTADREKKPERSAPARKTQKSVVQDKTATDSKAPAGIIKQALKETDSKAETLSSSGADAGRVESAKAKPKKGPINYYGIYVVRAGDNLWNIHFAFLREYLGHLGIEIALMDDEPIGSQSSGVGRILKYAENMVYIFNLKTKELSEDLNMLEPAEKIIIFNLPRLHSMLGSLTPGQLKTVRFDGRDLIFF